MLDNLLNPQFGVSALAEELGISRSELYRRVREAEQKSASQFIREIRLDKALELLKKDQYSIAEIAYMVGFNSPTYFSTCFKEYFGYSPSTADQNGHHEGAVKETSRPGRWKVPVILGVLAILVAVFGISSINKGSRPEMEKSLAVLEFDYLGTDSTQTQRARLLADGVLNNLSNRGGLRVVPASASFTVDKREACSKIGKNLGVDYLLDGSLSILGDQLKATVKLIDAREGRQLWARSFDSGTKTFPEFPEAISKEVAARLNHSTLPETKNTRSLQAMELYLQAKRMGDQRYKDSITQAIRLLEQAVDLDPYFAEAHGELSYLYGQMHYYGSISREERDKMMAHYLQKARELNPESPEVRFAEADFRFKNGQLPRDSSTILSGFRELRQAHPDNARYCYRLFQAYRAAGQYDLAHDCLEKTVQLEPGNSFYASTLARDLFWKRNEKGRALAIIGEEADWKQPHDALICFKAAISAEQAGKGYLPAVRAIERARKKNPFSDYFLFWGFEFAMDLDFTPLAEKYIDLYQAKLPENPIYTYRSVIRLLLAEGRFKEASELTQIWLNDKKLDPNEAAANLARLYLLEGDYLKSLEILHANFSGLLQKIETGGPEKVRIQLADIEPVRTYCEVLNGLGETSRAGVFSEYLCSFYSKNADASHFGNKLYPLDCLYLKGDLAGFLRALEEVFFIKGERLKIYTQLKTHRYWKFEEYPAYQALFKKIEKETHRQRAQVIAYLKEAGDWDPAWEAELD